MIEILKNDHLNSQLNSLGYCVTSFLEKDQLLSLKNIHEKLPISKLDGFYTSMNFLNVDERRSMDQLIKEITAAQIKKHTINHKVLTNNFVVKKSDKNSQLKLHLDWSICDEKKYIPIGIWSPLMDCTIRNGSFGLLKKSHQFGYTCRGSMMNFIASKNFKGKSILERIISDYDSTILEIPFGKSIIYDLRIAHFSPANKTNLNRIAVNTLAIPESASPLHYYLEPNGVIAKYNINEQFFTDYDMNSNSNPFAEKHAKTHLFYNHIEEQHNTNTSIDMKRIEIESHF